MSEQNDRALISRRRILQAAASVASLCLARVADAAAAAASLERLGTGTTRAGSGVGDELLALGARDVVDRIRRGELKTEAYVEQLLQQYEAHKNLNVVNAIDVARVLAAARDVDRARARGARLGPAAGLPFAVKGQISVAGLPSTGGNGALKGHLPQRNATAVQRLVDAGALPFCMTSLPDMTVPDGLMHQISSHSESFGAVRNPYDPTRVPGGSSGGNGAALAARIVPAALGLDTNGSIRLPSAFCGVVGLRPSTYTIDNAIKGTTRKRYPDDGLVIPPALRLDTIGPMARSVTDVAFLDSLITGEAVPSVDLRSARIAVPGPDYWEQEDVDPGVADVMQQAFAKLRDAGCTLVEIDFVGEVRGIVGSIFQPTPAAVFAGNGMSAPRPTPDTMAQWLRENAPDVTVEQMYHGRPIRNAQPSFPPAEEQVRALTEAARRYAEVFRTHDVLAIAFPTVPIVATRILAGGPREPLGELITIKGKQIEEGRVVAQNLFIAPRLGAAGLNIPAGLSQGLPVGLELDALPGMDSKLLGLGVAVQAVIGRIPPPSFS